MLSLTDVALPTTGSADVTWNYVFKSYVAKKLGTGGLMPIVRSEYQETMKFERPELLFEPVVCFDAIPDKRVLKREARGYWIYLKVNFLLLGRVAMGMIISGLFGWLFGKKQVRILMVGLDGAGKTTILYKLKLGEIITSVPTIAFNVETVEYKNISFNVWDFSGNSRIRPLRRHYCGSAQGLIFVVDSSDRGRIEECREELYKSLSEVDSEDVKLLVFANKQDLSNAMGVAELTEKLGLHNLCSGKWYIQGACATQGLGLYEGLGWLADQISEG
ncbi:unnamed protein product [Enterobius vermicularis]|uniref:ADP-ribosylation factor 1-like 2 n=1 Tax=Enterobius vermicularis TaxID=51028 RepID=A0A0N4V9B2_ENTVE|nr:unnamed protein product [Enterobius vermicularis]